VSKVSGVSDIDVIGLPAGVTQEMIDNLRLSRENLMLYDLQEAARTGADLEGRARQGETPVRLEKRYVPHLANASEPRSKREITCKPPFDGVFTQ